jgi:hypothetical protein
MPSPFPGMDPYLEEPRRWPDVHQSLITYIRDALQPAVRPRYHARMGERVYIMNPPRAIAPDVFLIARPRPDVGGRRVREAGASYSVQDLEADIPVVIDMPPVEYREPFVEIVHGDGEVVTVIEVLSPANKTPGEGHRQYRHKQAQLLASPLHLVEIDLLAAGLPTLFVAQSELVALPPVPPHRYLISVRRGTEPDRFETYPILLPDRLPRIRVPLSAPDPDVVLDVQAVFDRCYDNGDYSDLIDYRKEPAAPLSPEESTWLDGLLQGRGLRVAA